MIPSPPAFTKGRPLPWVKGGAYRAAPTHLGITIKRRGSDMWAHTSYDPEESGPPAAFNRDGTMRSADGRIHGWVPAASHPDSAAIYQAMASTPCWDDGVYEVHTEHVKETGVTRHWLTKPEARVYITGFPATRKDAVAFMDEHGLTHVTYYAYNGDTAHITTKEN